MHAQVVAAEGLVIKSVAFLNGGLLPGLHRPLLTQRLLSNAYIGAPTCIFNI